MVSASDLVIKSNDPKRDRVVWTGVIAAFVVFAACAYFLGQAMGGYSARESRSEIKRLGDENDSLTRSTERLRQQLADVETAQTIDASSYASLKKTVKELENNLATQGKELRFYRQIIAPEEKVEGLHLLEPSLLKLANSEGFQLDMVVYQFHRIIREVYGDVNLSVEGAQNGVPQTYSLHNLFTENSGEPAKFKFRYFQSFELRFVLPEGFTPNALNIEIKSPIKGYKTVTERIEWSDLLTREPNTIPVLAQDTSR